MAGFASGLAAGLGQGVQLAETQALREQQARAEAARQRNYESEAAHRTALEQQAQKNFERQSSQDEIKALQTQRDDLQKAIGEHPGDPTDPEYVNLKQKFNDVDNMLYDSISRAHPEAFKRQQTFKSNAESFASGEKPLTADTHGDAYDALSHGVGIPAEQLIVRAGQPNPRVDALQRIEKGLQEAGNDGGKMLLSGVNDFYGDELHGYVGQHLNDGSEVIKAEYAFGAPGQQPGQFTPVLKFTAKGPDGQVATQFLPMIAGNQPGNIHQTDVGNLIGHASAALAASNLLSNTPLGGIFEEQAKKRGKDVQAQLDERRVLNAPPAQLRLGAPELKAAQPGLAPPAAKTSLYDFGSPEDVQAFKKGRPDYRGKITTYVDDTGKFLGAQKGGEGGVQVRKMEPLKAELDQALLQQRRAEAWKATHPDTQVFMQTDEAGKPVAMAYNPKTQTAAPIEGLSGAAAKIGTPKPASAGGLAGSGRERQYTQRVLTAGQNAALSLENMSQLPVQTTTGFLGIGAGKADSILNLSSDILRRSTTPEFDQRYSSIMTGLGRLANVIEGAGLPGTSGMADKIQASITKQPGDKLGTLYQKMAQARQDVEEGLAAYQASPYIHEDQKQQFKEQIDRIHRAIPFTVQDTIEFAHNKSNKSFQKFLAEKNRLPATNTKGYTLHRDANGNFAYVSPDGKTVQEIK